MPDAKFDDELVKRKAVGVIGPARSPRTVSYSNLDTTQYRRVQQLVKSPLRAEIEAAIEAYDGPDAPPRHLAHLPNSGPMPMTVRDYVSAPALMPTGFPEYIFPGISISDVARNTAMSEPGMNRIFNGMRKAKHYTLQSIAAIYTDGDVVSVVKVIKDRVLRQLKATEIGSNRDPRRETKLKTLAAYQRDYPGAWA